MKSHEVCIYPFVATADEHTHADNAESLTGEIINRGWNVYVREYGGENTEGDWDEIYDQDFGTYEEAWAKANVLAAQYRAHIDLY